MHNFKKLDAWNNAIDLSVEIYEFMKSLPQIDQIIFSKQVIGCSVSIASNIAEGAGKDTDKDFNRYLGISTGSAFELETQLTIIKKIKPELSKIIESFLDKLKIIQKMIYRLKQTLVTS